MHGRLHGKIALLLEGESEIAAAAAVRFAREGARVALCGRDTERLEEVATAVADAGGSAYILQADVGHDAQIDAVFDQVIGEFGTLDVLVYCPSQRGATRAESAARKALVTMAARGGGAVVVVTPPTGSADPSSRETPPASLEALVRHLALEGAGRAVRVNMVAPGLVATERLVAGFTDPSQRTSAEHSVPLGRFARPDEIAAAIAFLASDDASYISGVTLRVDGGCAAVRNR